jgi:hypothetical protein
MRIQFKKEWVTPAIVGVASFAVGVGAGYFLKKYRDSRLEVVDQDIQFEEPESRSDQLQLQFDESLERMNSAIQQAHHVILRFADDGRAVLKERTMPKIQHDIEDHPSNRNDDVRSEGNRNDDVRPEDIGWDYTEEVKTRSPDHPYIIHRDEYFGNENDFTASSLTYYKGDNILCDELDVPVYNPEKVVGKLIFGHGSGDPSIVYICNEKNEAIWEVILDEGYYQSEVLGAQVEDDLTSDDLKHSILRFRGDTD